MMKKIAVLTGTATFAAGLVFAAAAHAMPSGQSAEDLVMQLQAQGNQVIVNRTGSQPLSQCTVAGVRAGQTYTRFDSGFPGAMNDAMSRVVSMTVYVDAAC